MVDACLMDPVDDSADIKETLEMVLSSQLKMTELEKLTGFSSIWY
jgi:hypothetical protein